MTDIDNQSKLSLRERVTDELREFAIITTYLYVCFAAILYLKASILHSHGIAYTHLGTAIIKAALCAKFMLVGRMMRIGEHQNRPLIVPTLHMAFGFLVLLIVLNVIEEAVVGVVHGRTIWDSISEIGGGTFEQMIATSLVMLLILIPYFAFRAIGNVVGDRTLMRLFFERRRG